MTSPPVTPRSRRRALAFSPYITVTPEYLVFPPPHHGRTIQNVVYLYNTDERPCVYKLRSEHPARYVAKPNVAIVAPTSATRIKVTLCPIARDSALAPDTRDRFRITVKPLGRPSGSAGLLPPDQWYASADPRQVWASTTAPACHEHELLAFFGADVASPPGGMVTYLPESYAASTSSSRAAPASGSQAQLRSRGGDRASQLPSAAVTTPGQRGGGGDGASSPGSGGSPQTRRQLQFDTDAGTPRRDGRSTSTSELGAGRPRTPRTWRSFVLVTLVAVSVAYTAGLAVRLHEEGRLGEVGQPSASPPSAGGSARVTEYATGAAHAPSAPEGGAHADAPPSPDLPEAETPSEAYRYHPEVWQEDAGASHHDPHVRYDQAVPPHVEADAESPPVEEWYAHE